jgi:hypothetical protein
VALREPDATADDIKSFYPPGISYVIVNGQVAMRGKEFTGVRAGQVLRK